jgi:hypothetical protein
MALVAATFGRMGTEKVETQHDGRLAVIVRGDHAGGVLLAVGEVLERVVAGRQDFHAVSVVVRKHRRGRSASWEIVWKENEAAFRARAAERGPPRESIP